MVETTSLHIEDLSLSDVLVALSVLRKLRQLTCLIEENVDGPQAAVVNRAVFVARCYYRRDVKQAKFIRAINNYAELLGRCQFAAAGEAAQDVAALAYRLNPFSIQSLPWSLVMRVLAVGALCIAVIPLVAVRPACCAPTEIVAIVLSALAALCTISLFLQLTPVISREATRVIDKLLDEVPVNLMKTDITVFKTNKPLTEEKDLDFHETEEHPANLLLPDHDTTVKVRKAIDSLLTEATEDDRTVEIRTRGFPSAFVRLYAVYRHTIIIMTDRDGNVVFWSEGAEASCGFSARDAVKNNINSLLYGEKSVEMYANMTEAAQKSLGMSEKTLTLAHSTLGSVSVNASVVVACDGQKRVIGYALIGSILSDEIARTQSTFHHYYLTMLRQLKVKDPQLPQIVECLEWKNLRDLSALAKDWNETNVRNLLSAAIRGRQRTVAVEMDPKVTELPPIRCDAVGVSGILTRTFNLFHLVKGKIAVRAEYSCTTDAVYKLIVTFQHDSTSLDQEALGKVVESANYLGGVVAESPGTLKLQLPFLVRGETNQPPQPEGYLTVKAVGHEPLIILLLERNAVYRHNISTIVWNCGHSLRVVEDVRTALETIAVATDLGCAIIDVDVKDADKVVDELISKRIYTIETSDAPEALGRRGEARLKKPISAETLHEELERATQRCEEAKRADEERMKRREVFRTVRNSPWTQGRLLGRGGFATVYEAISTMTGGKMAVKMIRVPGNFEDKINELMNEIEILCRLTHPNIIHYFYCERTETTVNLFMALADQGTVADLLKRWPRLPERHLATLLKQLLQAVNYLHENGIVHRDIKPGNMLLSHGQLKLSDFGTATMSESEGGVTGTLYYMAPEVIDGKPSGKESDIWSIGCVVCECLEITRPGSMVGYDSPTEFRDDISPEVVDFIKACMRKDPAERATAGALLLHDFIVHLDHEVPDLGNVSAEEVPAASPTVVKEESNASTRSSWSFD